MHALFHSDLLNFGTIILIIMILGGVVVAITMFAESVCEIRRHHAEDHDERTGRLRPRRNQQQGRHLPKSA